MEGWEHPAMRRSHGFHLQADGASCGSAPTARSSGASTAGTTPRRTSKAFNVPRSWEGGRLVEPPRGDPGQRTDGERPLPAPLLPHRSVPVRRPALPHSAPPPQSRARLPHFEQTAYVRRVRVAGEPASPAGEAVSQEEARGPLVGRGRGANDEVREPPRTALELALSLRHYSGLLWTCLESRR